MLENESGASEVVELRLRVRELEQQLQTARMIADKANADLAALRAAEAVKSRKRIVIDLGLPSLQLSQRAYARLVELGVPTIQQPAPWSEPVERPQELVVYILGEHDVVPHYWSPIANLFRDHPLVVRVVEELGNAASADEASSMLVIADLRADAEYAVDIADVNAGVVGEILVKPVPRAPDKQTSEG